MKGKTEQNRQEVIKEILCRYGSVDQLDVVCLTVRFHVGPEVIAEDIRRAEEALQQQAAAEQREALAQQERQAELARARQILRREV
jgi:hypothetical protein